MKLARIRVKHLMLAIAVLAVLIEVTGVGPRWRRYYGRARYQNWQTSQYLVAAQRFEEFAEQRRKEAERGGDADREKARLKEIEDAAYQADAFRQLAAWSATVG